MPDELVTAGPATDTPVVADAAIAPDQGATATPASDTLAPEGDTEAPKPRLFTQEEVDALIGKRLARERRALERELQQPQSPIPQAPASGEITIDQFETPEAYAEALALRKAADLLAERDATVQQRTIMNAHAEREEKARDRFEDYDDVVQNPQLRITPVMADVIRASDIGPEVAYFLGTNPKEAERISQLPAILQAKEIGRLELRLTNEPVTRKTTAAPAPITPVRATGGNPPVLDTTDPRSISAMSTSEWIARENARVAKARENRVH